MSLTPTALEQYDRDAPDTEDTETATFALGCFWGPDAQFGAMEGVVRTRVGYAGGTTLDPTYDDIGDHTEAVQVEYRPGRRSFPELLEIAFRSHDPRGRVAKTQYQNIVFTATAEQREALASYLETRGLDPDDIETRLEPLDEFYPAETYHQKYHLRSKRWTTSAFREAGYDDVDLRESPAAAKLNGHVAGHDVSDTGELGVGTNDPDLDELSDG